MNKVNSQGLAIVILMLLTLVTTIMSVSIGNLLIPVGLAYGIGFMILTWHRLDIALGVILVLAPWVQDVSGGGGVAFFSAAEVHIFMIVLVTLFRTVLERRLINIGKLTGPVLLYMAMMAVSSYQGGIERDDVIALFQTGVFCFVLPFLFIDRRVSWVSMRNALLAAACSTVILGLCEIAGGPNGAALGLGIHKNNMGQGMAAGLAIWMCLWVYQIKGWWTKFVIPALAIATIALLFTLSRGAWVGAGCALIAIAIMFARLRLLLRAVLLIIPLIALLWTYLPKEDQEYATGF
jgi:hypothetical protein